MLNSKRCDVDEVEQMGQSPLFGLERIATDKVRTVCVMNRPTSSSSDE